MTVPKTIIYSLIFTASALCAGIAAYLIIMTARVMPCDWTAYQPGTFYSYCASTAFGDYEHAAFIRGLEPEAIYNLQRADVILLGNSRMMNAFSTEATERFFSRHGIRYYLLGFGYGESSVFPLNIMNKYNIHPRMLIINADPFFSPWGSGVAYESVEKGILKEMHFRFKALLSETGRQSCQWLPSLCTREFQGFYRSVSNGHWIWKLSTIDQGSTPMEVNHNALIPGKLQHEIIAGEDFISRITTKPECIILTGVPTPQVNAAGLASAMGAALHLPVHNVSIDHPNTFDNNHLTIPSAEAWTTEFFSDFEPLLTRCIPKE